MCAAGKRNITPTDQRKKRRQTRIPADSKDAQQYKINTNMVYSIHTKVETHATMCRSIGSIHQVKKHNTCLLKAISHSTQSFPSGSTRMKPGTNTFGLPRIPPFPLQARARKPQSTARAKNKKKKRGGRGPEEDNGGNSRQFKATGGAARWCRSSARPLCFCRDCFFGAFRFLFLFGLRFSPVRKRMRKCITTAYFEWCLRFGARHTQGLCIRLQKANHNHLSTPFQRRSCR